MLVWCALDKNIKTILGIVCCQNISDYKLKTCGGVGGLKQTRRECRRTVHYRNIPHTHWENAEGIPITQLAVSVPVCVRVSQQYLSEKLFHQQQRPSVV